MISLSEIKKLREETKAGVMDCRRALEEAKGNPKKAKELLQKWGIAQAAKKEGREVKAGLVEAYVHLGGRIGVLVALACETDFVARTADFKNLAHELCLQIASMNPKNVSALLKQEYIRDPKRTVKEVVQENIGKFGENIQILRFTRFEL